nr:MAG TPA: hypothetical protein [Caudoviricetes sp.]
MTEPLSLPAAASFPMEGSLKGADFFELLHL